MEDCYSQSCGYNPSYSNSTDTEIARNAEYEQKNIVIYSLYTDTLLVRDPARGRIQSWSDLRPVSV